MKLERSGLIVVRIRAVRSMRHGETKAFVFQRHGGQQAGFLLCFEREFRAFANNCPHWNVDLDLGDGRFYDERFEQLVCRNHGALFEPRTGRCTAGPCVGAHLERFQVSLDGDDALIEIPEISLVFR